MARRHGSILNCIEKCTRQPASRSHFRTRPFRALAGFKCGEEVGTDDPTPRHRRLHHGVDGSGSGRRHVVSAPASAHASPRVVSHVLQLLLPAPGRPKLTGEDPGNERTGVSVFVQMGRGPFPSMSHIRHATHESHLSLVKTVWILLVGPRHPADISASGQGWLLDRLGWLSGCLTA